MHVYGKGTDCTRRRETLVQYDIYRRHQKKMLVLWARLLGTPPGSHHAMAPEDPRLSDRHHPSRLHQRYGTCRKRKRNKQGSTYGVPETVCSEAGRAFYVKGAVLVRTGSTLESYGGGAPGKDDGSKPRRRAAQQALNLQLFACVSDTGGEAAWQGLQQARGHVNTQQPSRRDAWKLGESHKDQQLARLLVGDPAPLRIRRRRRGL